MAHLEEQIDELYQLPPEEFTRSRNALAKSLAGERKRQVAALRKPTLPIWAVNQLHWLTPATYRALIDAAEKLRAGHRAVLAGKKADLRKADQLHRGTVERALAKTIDLMDRRGVRPSEAVTAAIRRILTALPDGSRPGRLTREPEPAGFSLLEGVHIKAGPVPASPPPSKPAAPKESVEKQKVEQQKARRDQADRRRSEMKARRALENARRAEIRASNRLKAAQRRLEELEGK